MTRTGCLFDVINPEPVREPVVVSATLPATERKRLNAAALRVLAHLQHHGEATNVELCAPHIGGNRAVGRVWELIQHGYDIRKEHLHGGTWKYRLVQ